MKKKLTQLPVWIAYFFILLFCYAAISKILDFENFQVQIAQSPLLSAYAVVITYGILALELLVCFLLIFRKTRIAGLFGAYILMVLFTVYIYLILNFSEFIPCSCGGILEKMDWNTHLIFNIVCIAFAVSAILLAEEIKIGRSKTIITLIFSAGLCSVGMFFLYQKSEYLIKRDNGFQRRFLQHPILKDKTYDLKLNSYYFAGFNADTIYLGNYTAPALLTKVFGMKAVAQSNLSLDHKDLQFRRPMIEVIDSVTYFYDGTVPIIFEGTNIINLKEQNIGKTYFRKIRNLDKDHFVVAAYHRKRQIQTLGILSRGGKDSVMLKPELLDKMQEGFFEPDGDLNYDRYTGKIVYVYHYKNKFMVTDKSLTSKQLYKTIDTVTIPKLGLSHLSNGNKKLNNPLIINKRSFAYKNVLFIESDRRGKLEKDRGRRSIILDLYSTSEQKYLGSISVPNRNEGQHVQFTVHDNCLYLIIENELIRYRFAQNIMQHFISGEAENLNQSRHQ